MFGQKPDAIIEPASVQFSSLGTALYYYCYYCYYCYYSQSTSTSYYLG